MEPLWNPYGIPMEQYATTGLPTGLQHAFLTLYPPVASLYAQRLSFDHHLLLSLSEVVSAHPI